MSAIRIREHLLGLHAEAGGNITSSTSEAAPKLGQLIQLDLDIEIWEKSLLARPEAKQLTAARRELGFATYAVSGGLYLHAYAGLRLFLELCFAAVYFSANELHRRRWVADRADFSWSKALDRENGVLAPSFVREFSETASQDAQYFADSAAKCYRHCSQFIHGKLAVTDALPDQLGFNGVVLSDWLVTARDSAKAALFLLYARYGDELLPADEAGRLSSTIESSFSHLKAVREQLGLPIETEAPDAS